MHHTHHARPDQAPCLLCTTPTYGTLCTGCATALHQRLHRMPRLYRALAAVLQPVGRASSQYGSARPVEAPLPVAMAPLALRGPGGMVGVLEDWHQAVHAERGWALPTQRAAIEARVATAAGGLIASMPWIVHWPQAGDLARELRLLDQAVLRIVDPPDTETRARPAVIGPCPALTSSGTTCRTVLHHQPGTTVIHCPGCGTTYPPATWPGLAARIAHDTTTEPTAHDHPAHH
ncbi:hypothetical protein ACWGDX_02965 [Streptomyces sp. NPDC055025]